jgi:hypothetical protein
MILEAGRSPANRQLPQQSGKRPAREQPVPAAPCCVDHQNMNRLILTFSRIARPIMDVIIDVPP